MQYWKSSNGSIKFSEMTTSHLAKAWSGIVKQINNNKLLPLDLVVEAGLDRYEGDSLEKINYCFSVEWQRRSAEAKHVAVLEKEAAAQSKSYRDFWKDRLSMSAEDGADNANDDSYLGSNKAAVNMESYSYSEFPANNYEPDYDEEPYPEADHAYTELKNIEARFNARYILLLERKVSPDHMLSLFKAYGKA